MKIQRSKKKKKTCCYRTYSPFRRIIVWRCLRCPRFGVTVILKEHLGSIHTTVSLIAQMARRWPLLQRNDENIFLFEGFVQHVPSCYGLPHASLGLLKILGETACFYDLRIFPLPLPFFALTFLLRAQHYLACPSPPSLAPEVSHWVKKWTTSH